MSTTDLYRVYRTCARHIAEFRNGWGSAPVIWGYLNQRYLGGDRYNWGGYGRDCKPLWDLAKQDRVPRTLRLAHAFTFDWAVCPPDKAKELADALEEAGKLAQVEQHVNHWPAIAEELRKHKPRARQIGIGISCTSVNDIWIDWKGDPTPWNVFGILKCSAEGERDE